MRILFLWMLTSWVSFCNAAEEKKDSADTEAEQFSGLISLSENYNFKSNSPLNFNASFIPVSHLRFAVPKKRLIDVEASVRFAGLFSYESSTKNQKETQTAGYRYWLRYSSRQFELRAGLQKINFGSATFLRPLMWFDQIDPRDPLKLTAGVWGILGRYYFLNNTNIWIWGLYGNNSARPYDTYLTQQHKPELGGRWQFPVNKGEIAFTYNHRYTNGQSLPSPYLINDDITEHRFGLDGRWDIAFGLWFEAAWITERSHGILRLPGNREMLTLGSDYTFAIGDGLSLTAEQLFASADSMPFAFNDPAFFTCTSLAYPLGIADKISGILYVKDDDGSLYNFISYNHTYKNLSAYLIAYLNPSSTTLPQQGSLSGMYAGKGLLAQLIFNY